MAVTHTLAVGVLALQGGFHEHIALLRRAAAHLTMCGTLEALLAVDFIQVRTPAELSTCDALIIPGGESTTMALVAAESGLLGPLRHFVKTDRKPTWGTCAGLILLANEATGTRTGGQELIGGLDVHVHRNHFGRQMQSFIADLSLPFLEGREIGDPVATPPFPGVFIRAPIVERLLHADARKGNEASGVAHAPTCAHDEPTTDTPIRRGKVKVLAVLPKKRGEGKEEQRMAAADGNLQCPSLHGDEEIIAVQQDNILGTSFHPELTDDIRMHVWWLELVARSGRNPGM